MRYIANVSLLTPGGVLADGALVLDGGRIVALGPRATLPCPSEVEAFDGNGALAAPGLIDLQLNGAAGHDLTAEPATLWAVAGALPRFGVTSFLPTIITSAPERIAAAQAVLAAGPPQGWRGARPLGLHLEGPFLNPAHKGAHDPALMRAPDLELAADWSPATGVRLVTLAPELPGAHSVIAALAARGVVVSAGHSGATYDEALAAYAAGVGYATHLFNAMPPLHHRSPGLVGALLGPVGPIVGLIADGLHVHPALVALAWRALGPRRLNLVSDAMAALGMPPGTYRLGAAEVTVDATSARLADGTLAGSVADPATCLRNLCAFAGCTFAEALATLTTTPADLLGLADYGRLVPGAVADVVLFDDQRQVVATFVGGELAFAA